MNMTNRSHLAGLLFAFSAILSGISHAGPPPLPRGTVAPTQTGPQRSLISDTIPQEASKYVPSTRYLRSRLVAVKPNWLPEPGGTISAGLFEDRTFQIQVVQNSIIFGTLLAKGYVDGDTNSLALFSSWAGLLSGVIHSPDGRRFLIFPSPEGNHVVAEVDPQLPICSMDGLSLAKQPSLVAPQPQHTTPMKTLSSAGTNRPLTASLPNANTIVDVIALYNTNAASMYGGDAGIRTIVTLGIGYANSAFVNSGIAAELRLLYYGPAPDHLQSSDAQSEELWFSGNSTVQNLRNTYGADLACEITTVGGWGDCFGYYSISFNDPSTFAHEIGHNLGGDHDINHAACNHFDCNYNYGYVFTATGATFGDLMCYNVANIPYFSNPSVDWRGVAIGTSTANNALRINSVVSSIASANSPKVCFLQNPRFPSGSTPFYFDLAGPTSQAGTYTFEYTSDYSTWTTMGSFSFTGGTLTVIDYSVTGSTARRFYRAKQGSSLIGSEVGFIRITIPTGDSMLGNQLEAVDNRISALWPNPPDNVTLLKFDPGVQSYVSNSSGFSAWDDPNMSLAPGEGVIIENSTGVNQTLTFVGHVWQSFNVHLPLQWAIVCSPVPQSAAVSSVLGFPYGYLNDKLDRMTSTAGTYQEYTSSGNSWSPTPEPTINIGEAFWSYKGSWGGETSPNNNWSRVFWTWP